MSENTEKVCDVESFNKAFKQVQKAQEEFAKFS